MAEYLMNEKEIEKLKEVEFELLCEFDRVCKQNNLTYFLFGGTLLGAVRHGGFIPWDDDIDVVMPREDLNKLEKISHKVFDNKYFFQSSETEKGYPLMVAKLRKNGTIFEELAMTETQSHKGIFIDVFPLDKLDVSNEKKIHIRCKLIAFLNTIISYNCGYDYGLKLHTKILSKIFSIFGVKTLKKLRLKLMCLDNRKNITTVSVIASNYGWKKQLMDVNVYYPGSKIKFEGKEFNAPNNVEQYLINIYGDYMKLPPKEKQISRHPISKLCFGGEYEKV